MWQTTFVIGSLLLPWLLISAPGQDPSLNPENLERIHDCVLMLDGDDLLGVAAATRELTVLLDVVGQDAPAYLAEAELRSTPATKARLERLRKSLERWFRDDPIWKVMQSFRAPSVASLERIRVGTWHVGTDGEGSFHESERAWFVREEAGELVCLDSSGIETRLRLPAGIRRPFPTARERDGSEPIPTTKGMPPGDDGTVYQLADFREEAMRALEERCESSVLLAWWCRERGLHVEGAAVLDRVPEDRRNPESIRGGLAGTLRWQAYERLSQGAPRAHIVAILERSLPMATGAMLEEHQTLAAALREMAAEDAAHRAPEEASPMEERIRHLVFGLRDVAMIPMSNPGSLERATVISGFEVFDGLAEAGFPAVPRLIEALSDQRPTRSYSWWRSFAPESFRIASVSYMAKIAIRRISGKHLYSEAECVEWWRENEGKSSHDILVAQLRSEEESNRLEALQRLQERDWKDYESEILESLRGIARLRSSALEALHPEFVKAQPLVVTAFLDDREFLVRFAAARRLTFAKLNERRAIDAVLELLGDGRVARDSIDFVSSWLLETGDAAARKAVFALVITGATYGVKESVIKELDRTRPEGALEALASAFGDTAERRSSGGLMESPRICDLAGHAASGILGAQLDWKVSQFERDDLIVWLRAAIAAKGGAKPAPRAGPTPDAASRIGGLAPLLASDDAAVRASALDRLAELGPGAFEPLSTTIPNSSGATRRWLEAARRDLALRVRHVDVAAPFEAPLAAGRALSMPALRESVVERFAETPSFSLLRIRLARTAGGGGVRLKVECVRSPGETRPCTSISYSSRGGGGMSNEGDKAILEVWDEAVHSFERDLAGDPSSSAWIDLEIKKRWN